MTFRNHVIFNATSNSFMLIIFRQPSSILLYVIALDTSNILSLQMKLINRFSRVSIVSLEGVGNEIKMCVIFDKIKRLDTLWSYVSITPVLN